VSFTTTLKISGSAVTRSTARLILNRWTISLDRPDELEFTEVGTNLPGSYAPEQNITLIQNSVNIFSGWIVSRHPSGMGSGPIDVGYRCMGLKYGAYLTAITASDGTGTMRFNLPTTDPLYSPTEAGLSVGTIIGQIFSQNSTALSTYTIATDSTTTSQLAALTVVPPDPVYISGPSLMSQIDQLLQQWYGSRYGIYIQGNGLVRVIDTLSLTAQTLTLGTDLVKLDSMTEDTSECFTQVVIRGRDLVESAWVDLSLGTLIDPNKPAGTNLEASWTYQNFLYPVNAFSQGTINSMTASTLTITSANSAEHWIANYWSGIQGQVGATDIIGTGATANEYRRVTANTALTAGGTSVLTLDSPLVNSGYNHYMLRGVPQGISECYRRYNFLNTYVAEHLVPQFPYPVPFVYSSVAIQTLLPIGMVTYSQGGITIQVSRNFTVVPFDGTNPGYIQFNEPVVTANNSMATLITGGGAVVYPTNVQALVPFAVGALQTQWPASGFGGTAFSLFNVQRTLYRDYPNWIDPGSTTLMTQLAQQIFNTVSNALQEGQFTFYGQLDAMLPPNNFPAVNIAHFSRTTGYETMAAPCRTITLEWPQNGGSTWITRGQFSTRRQAYSGDRLYVHPSYASGGSWGAGLGNLADAGFNAVSGGNVASVFQNQNFDQSPEFSPSIGGSEQDQFRQIFGALPGDKINGQQMDRQQVAAMNQAERQQQTSMEQNERAAFKQTFGVLPGGSTQ
jgi:hypothetical protein